MGRFALRLCLVGGLLAPATWLACSSFDGGNQADGVDASSTPTPGVDSAPPPDRDAGDASEAELPAFDAGTNWSSFDLRALVPSPSGWLGSAFDGKFIYFSPLKSTVVRYDTTKPFEDVASWSKFDASSFGDAGALSAIVTTEWVYFLPSFNATPVGRVAYRFRRSGDFDSGASWESVSFEAFANDAGISSLGGAAFDGEKIVGIPFYKPAVPKAADFTTFKDDAGFTDASAWQLDTSFAASSPDFVGAALVGGYIYTTTLFAPRLIRFPANLSTKDQVVLPLGGGADAGLSGSFGVITDGRWVYPSPHFFANNGSGKFVRYDSTMPFTNPTSYESFDLAAKDSQLVKFTGGTWDGRFVYFTPYDTSKFIRYDTQKKFDASSFEVFDGVPSFKVQLRSSAAFDGQYVYFPSASDGLVVRFRARNTRDLNWPASTSTF